jgi:hypothetical protein
MRYAVALGLVLTVAGLAKAEPLNLVAIHDLPPAVRQSADATALVVNPRGVKWLVAALRNNGYYCILGKDADDRRMEFICDRQGGDSYLRVEMPMSDVPAVVADALSRQMPNFQPTKVQQCTLDGRRITVYRFQGAGYEGGDDGVYVSPSGQKVTPVK